ncbi:stage II sporulation protein M [Paenibacillus cymbidii]|uniref:stage II sporulation protein M n=1 Tax=Paenibacillus cymbidii TaxID=1639034 RepID=UPI0014369EBD|nr:stage II sporulation protein M [Paenibacillus cymbidii]
MNIRALLLYARGMKHYFIAATLVFAVGIWLGAQDYGSFSHLIDSQKDRLQSIVNALSQGEYQNLKMFLFIFLNNSIVTTLIMFTGAFLMIMPLYSLLTNGMLLGHLAAINDHQLGRFFQAVLPHGIIEIPAILIASAFGIRLGVLTLQAFLSLPFPTRRARAGGKLLAFFRVSIPLLLVLVALLFVAAVIESTLTMWLVEG